MEHPHSTKNLVSYVNNWIRAELQALLLQIGEQQVNIRRRLTRMLKKVKSYSQRSIGFVKRMLTEELVRERLVQHSLDGSLLRSVFRSSKLSIGSKALLVRYYSQIHRLLLDPDSFVSWNQ